MAYDAIVGGSANITATSARQVAEQSHKENITDEFIKPAVIVGPDGAPLGPIRDGDSVVFFNFRADRARQMTRAIALEDFDGFERPSRPSVHYTTMTVYDRTFGLPVVFDPQSLSGNFADVIQAAGRSNLRLAETEKYAHVTYFFNCGREHPYEGESRVLVPSQKVATYDLMPQMSAPGITDVLVDDLDTRKHDIVICNFANADMVGHTGSLEATIAAVETLDVCLGRIMKALLAANGTCILTSDHGNAEQMWDNELNAPHTAHTANPVPVILCGESFVGGRLRDGTLRDVAPTMLQLLGIEPARGNDRGERCWRVRSTPTPNSQLQSKVGSFWELEVGSWKLFLFDFFFLRLVGGNAQRAEETLIVRADVEFTPIGRAHSLHWLRDLGQRGLIRPVHEADDGLEGDFHFEASGSGTLARSLNPGIVSNSGTNGVGELTSQPVHDVIHTEPPHRRRSWGPGRVSSRLLIWLDSRARGPNSFILKELQRGNAGPL